MTDKILGHWLPAAAILLLCAAFALAQIDRFGPSQDAFLSLNNAGWAGDRAKSLPAVLDSLRENSPQHAPLHYLLLHAWGRLVGRDLAMGRALTVLTAVLGYAAMYRLARDNIGTVAGLFAMTLLASNAFYTHYIAYVRMYAQLVLCAALALWLYTRLHAQSKMPGAKELLAFFAACLALLATHAWGLTLFAALAAHHLLVAQKDARWRRMATAAFAAFVCFAPWFIGVMATQSSAEGAVVTNPATPGEFLLTWLTVTSNGSPLLLALACAGWLVTRRRSRELLSWLSILALFLALSCLLAVATDSVSAGRMRYLLAGMPLAALAIAAGMHAWHLRRRFFAWLLLALWLAAGWWQGMHADWDDLLGQRARAYWLPPWQVISRQARDWHTTPAIVAYKLTHHQLTKGTKFGLSQADHFFGQYGMPVRQTMEFRYLEGMMKDLALRAPLIWLVTQDAKLDADERQAVALVMESVGYARCGVKRYEADTRLTAWTWRALQCQAPQLRKQHHNNAIGYDFYGANLDGSDDALRFRYRWRAQPDAKADNLRISHQLLDADWQNVAQLDLPLLSEDEFLQFHIDITHVLPGDYALMAVVYYADTGQRLAWQGNEGWIPEMQQLAQLTILPSSANPP